MHLTLYPLFLGNPFEFGILFAVVLILFGPGKLPDVFRSLGDGVRQFKDASTNPPLPPAQNSTAATGLPPVAEPPVQDV